MKVDLYEKVWMWGAGGLIVVFLASMLFTIYGMAMRPPSHVETIDPATIATDPRFDPLGPTTQPDGSVQVNAIARIWSFQPPEIRVPAGRLVTFRVTSPDVIHGFEIVGTNANMMIIPGYISQVTTEFAAPGEYLILCNEYCGLGHDTMAGKLIVTEDVP